MKKGKITNPNLIIDELVGDYKEVYGNELLSLAFYGSSVTHEYIPGVSEVNVVIVTGKDDIDFISRSADIQKKWFKKGVELPFFMTEEYIKKTLDSYPLEFLAIKQNHKVLLGVDFWESISIKKEDVRLQCEREIKGLALHIRRSYVYYEGNRKELFNSIKYTLDRLVPVFKGLLFVEDITIPASISDVISRIESTYGIESAPFSMANSIKKYTGLDDYKVFYKTIVTNVDKIMKKVDNLEVV